MVIKFTSHALLKIEILKKHGIDIPRGMIEDIIKNPDIIEHGYRNRKVAQEIISERHVLRVVYEKTMEGIIVITMYPGRRARYEKDKI
ncbi:MAG: DUF4258 domain-containing protein [Nitrospirae bacterium]|nr:MAG: DUF4258 domain-containing protein [Nitrospirota bacterium]